MQTEQAVTDHEHRNKIVNWAICGVLAVAGLLLIIDHWSHVMGMFPYLLFLACPLMHLFVHHGQGGHHHGHRDVEKKDGA